ncbi:L,D-transpeptidase family protein [Tateyamaria pelophila]|uniref:L,D-transpeptidase family protein n=1 Tax=Tateyamaria pelophila TaxID=328415 RepID=UPI001CBEFF01|nr:L,D-transpeptidase family protein [Tateyamaria pelophila]
MIVLKNVFTKFVGPLVLFLCFSIATISFAEGPSSEQTIPGQPSSAFQNLLDDNGIDFQIPPEGKAILVNIPAFELTTFQDGAPVFRSKVIVGAPWHRTPRVQTFTSAVRFRPTWRPTPSMIASGEYRDRVVPAGPNNPLGLAAVRLQQGMLVYLHDTNHRELFDLDARALSHGCIRVQRWDDLVAWLLDMSLDQVHAHANGSRTFDIPTPPVPVTLGYFTVFPDASGSVVRYPDIYNLGKSAAVAPEIAPSTVTSQFAERVSPTDPFQSCANTG